MAAGLAFHYVPGDSFLHRWDPRCKVAALAFTALAILQAGPTKLAFLSLAPPLAVYLSRLPLKPMLRDLKMWGIFLGMIFAVKVLFHPGAPGTGLAWPPSPRAFQSASWTCWRLVLVLGLAVVFTAVTRPREVRDVVHWILEPLPFLPARRIALMVSLTIRFLPLLLDEWEEVKLAARSRLGDRRKGFFKRAKFIALPLFRRAFLRADDMSFALAARGYRDDVAVKLPSIAHGHLAGLGIFLAVLLFVWTFPEL